MKTVIKYASVVERYQNSSMHTNDWVDLGNACNNQSISATSEYNVNGGVKYTPSQLYVHDFDISLPEMAKIKNINFEVRIKGTDVDVQVPRANFLFNGKPAHQYQDNRFDDYSIQPNVKLSSSSNNISYLMDEVDVSLSHLNKNMVESDNFGIILSFNEQSNTGDGGVALEWVRVIIEYDEPKYILELRGSKIRDSVFDASFYYKLNVGDTTSVRVYLHSLNLFSYSEVPVTLHLDVPLGLHIESYYCDSGVTFNPNTRDITYAGKGNSPFVDITFKAVYTGGKAITVTGPSHIGSLTKYAFVEKGWIIGADEDVAITSSVIRRWEESCFHFIIKTINEDGTAGFDIHLDGNDRTQSNHLVSWNIDESRTSDGVVWNEAESNDDYIEFFVPEGKEVELHFTGCFLPKTTGANTLVVESTDTGFMYTYDYVSLEPYTYVFDLLSHDIAVTDARIVTTINTGAYSYPVAVSRYDANLVTDKSSLRLSKFEDIDYIGCVALKQTHYNPKSTYKDTLLNTYYKNKRYMGKKGAIDETITLNVRLPPKDVTTMQGLVEMDKPVPINANHRCFEGDALNHRGWCELYGITTENTGNNPHWYKCQLSVKYITHNLNTRFKINKGSRVSDYFLHELLTPVYEYGDDLTKKFYIETNGGYFYSDDIEDYHMRNSLPLPNGKSFAIRGMERLSIKSQINLNWYSTRNIENVHNNMSRIVRLIDAETNNAVLEYEWYDVDFSRTYEYNCRVICRVLHKGAYKTILNRNLVLNKDIEYDPTETGGLDVYGSELIFKIVGDKLTIQDCGFSGKELYVEDIDIQNGQYYFDVEFKNNNANIDAPDINNWIDIDIKELQMSSLYSNFYKNMLVSPFPVPDKQVIFTRRSEEGTIFYLLDDGLETSYMVNPYYSYHCGVDLQSRDGISIFNLDNNYSVVYITNGLIKVGINRYNGKMYLYKYDSISDEYILTNRFQLTKYEDININSFSDDKIELQVSDSILTMWRGHPYLHIAHPTENIAFNDKFTKIYADGVGDKMSTLPMFYNLIDTTNLLNECIGSKRKIKKDCWIYSETEISDKSNQAWVTVRENGGIANESLFTADCEIPYTSMYFIIDGVCYEGEPAEEPYLADLHQIKHQFGEIGKHTVQAVYFGENYTWSKQITIEIEDNAYHITPTFPSKMYYLQNDYTCVLTYRGQPVANETIVFYVNGLSYPKLTDENGVARLNNRLSPLEQQSVVIDGVPTDNGESQPSSYLESYKPYLVSMDYWENGERMAHAEKECTIEKGFVNIAVDTLVVTQGNRVTWTFTNNLDPNDDDISPEEVYISGKSVMLSVNGVNYPRITSSTGQCKLQFNLNPGTYDVQVVFNGDNQYNGTIKNYEVRVNEQ